MGCDFLALNWSQALCPDRSTFQPAFLGIFLPCHGFVLYFPYGNLRHLDGGPDHITRPFLSCRSFEHTGIVTQRDEKRESLEIQTETLPEFGRFQRHRAAPRLRIRKARMPPIPWWRFLPEAGPARAPPFHPPAHMSGL